MKNPGHYADGSPNEPLKPEYQGSNTDQKNIQNTHASAHYFVSCFL
jgi:hypothetical protein